MEHKWKFTFESHQYGYAQCYKHGYSGWWVGVISTDNKPNLWWSKEFKKWLPLEDIGNMGGGNHKIIGTGLRAFKRHLRNHPELQGYKVYYASRLVYNDVTATFE